MQKTDKHKNDNRFLYFSVGFFLLLFAFYGLRYMAEKNYRPESLVKRTENIIQSIGYQCINTQNSVFKLIDQKKGGTWRVLNKQFSGNQHGILVEKRNMPIYWNNNRIPARQLASMTSGKITLLFFGNRKYVGLKKTDKNYTVGIFSLLTKDKLPYGIQIENHPTTGKNEYLLKKYNIALKIKPGVMPPFVISIFFFLYAAIFFYLAFLLFLIYQNLQQNIFRNHSGFLLLLFFTGLLIIRSIQYYLGVPAIFTNSFWVSGQITNLTAFKTPADLVLNFLLLGIGLVVLLQYLNKQETHWKKYILLKLLFFQILLFVIPIIFYLAINGILQNSGLILFPENVYFSITGFALLLLFLITNSILYLSADGFLGFFRQKRISFGQIIATLTLVAISFLLFSGIEKTITILSYAVLALLTSIIWFVNRNKKPYLHSILTLLILSLSAAYFLNTNELENKNAHQRFTANMLTQKQDPFLQYLLKSQAKAILSDTNIIAIIKSKKENKEQLIFNYLKKKYFRGMLSSYSKQLTLCEPGQQLEIQPDNKIVGCDAFFSQFQGKIVDKSKGFVLSLVNNTSESIYYLVRFHFPLLSFGEDGVNLYIEFYTNIIPKGLGYPELLRNTGTEDLHLSGYSFAFYERGKLEYKFGDYLYPIDLSDLKKAPARTFFKKNDYIHYLLPDKKNEVLIVSRLRQTPSGWLLPFSLLFILSGIFLLIYVSFRFGKQILETFSYSFSTRMQLTIFSSMLIVFFFLTAIILYYFSINSQQTISNNLKEKTHSVIIELQNKLAPYGGTVLQNKQEIQSYLQKFSMIFFSDINLYNNSGTLIVSSRPEIFSRGLQSRLINPKAYTEIEKKHKLFYLGKEKIQNVAFYSSYAPFILNNGVEEGIINLPYFARQSELQHTYYQMLTNLINLFVITGLLGMLLMVYLSKLLTRPLNILQHKITSVSIEKQNEKIEWNRNDEIGKLIKAYNQMVEKLEESARLMKYSAREKAWHEMARQIAHEVRNPLTPMKLNVQYLQKVYSAKDPSFDEKFKSVSRSLINQIDAMNEVAGMFADFSKIKIPAVEKANLTEAIKSTVTLFRKSYPINITIESESNDMEVKASMQDLLRIFNNLLKNAVQAMENTQGKNIRIQLLNRTEYVEVRVTDNGKGISESDKEHIFRPYFTTKSKGTGLGLAIVKNLMTEMGGEIIFVSEKGLGTTFILKFPYSTR